MAPKKPLKVRTMKAQYKHDLRILHEYVSKGLFFFQAAAGKVRDVDKTGNMEEEISKIVTKADSLEKEIVGIRKKLQGK